MKLVIFDCDGTLVDSQANITAAMAYAFRAHGLEGPAAHEVLRCVGLSLPETFRVLAAKHPAHIRASLAEHYRNAFVSGAIPRREDEEIYPGIAAAVATLGQRDDVLLGVATGKSKRGVARLFDSQGWHDYFHTIQTADDHPSKPDPSMILTAMAEAGVGPEATVMVGDTTFDIEMARNAGVGAIGVAWGYHEPERLTGAGAHQLVGDGGNLLAAIEQELRRQSERG